MNSPTNLEENKDKEFNSEEIRSKKADEGAQDEEMMQDETRKTKHEIGHEKWQAILEDEESDLGKFIRKRRSAIQKYYKRANTGNIFILHF